MILLGLGFSMPRKTALSTRWRGLLPLSRLPTSSGQGPRSPEARASRGTSSTQPLAAMCKGRPWTSTSPGSWTNGAHEGLGLNLGDDLTSALRRVDRILELLCLPPLDAYNYGTKFRCPPQLRQEPLPRGLQSEQASTEVWHFLPSGTLDGDISLSLGTTAYTAWKPSA
jgi:hypothetical protein